MQPTRTVGVLAALLTACWCNADVRAPGPDLHETPTLRSIREHWTRNFELRIGPVHGLTTVWHEAPDGTAIPLGTIAQFRVYAPANAVVTWEGAEEIQRTSRESIAICPLMNLGETHVEVTAATPTEHARDACHLTVLNVAPRDIRVSEIGVPPQDIKIDEDLPPDEINERTVDLWFGPSIAAVRKVSDGYYRTSTGREVAMSVAVEPTGFAPLMEWRVDEEARAIGGDTTIMINSIGAHAIDVGPIEAPASVELETYEVTIVKGEPIEEGSIMIFEAVTDPPGYEEEITWISATKYGKAEPVMGEGPVFVAGFGDTWGPHPHGGFWQWVGVKADNASRGEDNKCDDQDCFDVILCDLKNCAQLCAVQVVAVYDDERGPAFDSTYHYEGGASVCLDPNGSATVSGFAAAGVYIGGYNRNIDKNTGPKVNAKAGGDGSATVDDGSLDITAFMQDIEYTDLEWTSEVATISEEGAPGGNSFFVCADTGTWELTLVVEFTVSDGQGNGFTLTATITIKF